jgi:hypothetical protein
VIPSAISLRPLSESQARLLTQEIAETLAVAWDKVVEAYQRRVWEPLGYGSWDSYCRAELGSTRLRLPSEEREEAVRSLRSAGLSTRAIAAATGLSPRTAAREAARVPNGTRDHGASRSPVTGMDGKSYPTPRNSGRDPDEPIDAEIVEEEEPEPVTPAAPATVSNAKRRPLAEAAKDAGWEIRRAAERVARIVGDDRLPTNKQQVSSALRSHLLFVAEAVTAALGELSDHN